MEAGEAFFRVTDGFGTSQASKKALGFQESSWLLCYQTYARFQEPSWVSLKSNPRKLFSIPQP